MRLLSLLSVALLLLHIEAGGASPVAPATNEDVIISPRGSTAQGSAREAINKRALNHPAGIVAGRGNKAMQEADIRDLSTTDLFKTLVIYDVQQRAREGLQRASAKSGFLPSLSGLNPFVTHDYVVRFDRNRPLVQLPSNRREVKESVIDLLHDRYYHQLNVNHDASFYRGGEEPVANVRSPDSAYMDIRPSTRRVTETQLTKQALEALGRTREWAKEQERAHPGTMPQEAVDRALDWAWAVWLKGTGMGAGHADFPVDTIISKMAR
jgi:hypothetical protein